MKQLKKPVSTWVWVVLVLAFAAFAGLMVWLYGCQMLVEPETMPVTTTKTSTVSTANWKTYTNDAYKFSLKYPSNWNPFGGDSNLEGLLFGYNFDDGDMFNGISVNIWDKKIDYFVSLNKDATTGKKEINNLEWTTIDNPMNVSEHTPALFSYLIEHNGKVYQLIGETKSHKADIDLMISTFQFTK